MCKRGVRNERQINTKSSGLRAFMCSLSVGTMAAEVSTDVKAGDKISTRAYWNGGEGGSALVQQPHYYDKGETTEHDSLGVVDSVGVGYRRLSEHEHAYVGGNIFYDYAVNDKLARVGVGMEYVSGLNTISANVYHGLSEKKTEPYLFWNDLTIIPGANLFHDTMPGDPLADTPNGMRRYRYAYKHVLDGFDI